MSENEGCVLLVRGLMLLNFVLLGQKTAGKIRSSV